MSGLQKSKQGNHIQAMVENEGLLNMKMSVHSVIDSSFDFVLYEDILKRITLGVFQFKQVSLYMYATVYFGH